MGRSTGCIWQFANFRAVLMSLNFCSKFLHWTVLGQVQKKFITIESVVFKCGNYSKSRFYKQILKL
ncbi:hypothetical protein C4X99_13380 [Leptospira interrogans serovar Geyaweera]|nr:hypothetical protein C5473_09150 [Leptospira interrogans serovar Weerasinghe]KAA1291226.1 hypothetical protein C4X99_13380 [Leptospira interrogans serovar Geyaweera]